MLVRNLGALRNNQKEASRVIAANSLSDGDWQLGCTKVFLKVDINLLAVFF